MCEPRPGARRTGLEQIAGAFLELRPVGVVGPGGVERVEQVLGYHDGQVRGIGFGREVSAAAARWRCLRSRRDWVP